MNKNRVRLSESQLHRIIEECVNRVLREEMDEGIKDTVVPYLRHPFNKEKRSRLKDVMRTEPNSNANGRAIRRYKHLTDPNEREYMDKMGYDDTTGDYHYGRK